MGLYKTKKLLLNKRNHQQNKKAASGMGEDICKHRPPQGVNV